MWLCGFLITMGCESDSQHVARVFISHVIRLEYGEAAVYADDTTALRLHNLASEIDTTSPEIRELRTYTQKFSLENLKSGKDTVLFRWCCHADGMADSFKVYFHKGRWRVSWKAYVPNLNTEQDTVYKVEYVY